MTYPIMPGACVVQNEYTGTKDYDNTYLGFNNAIAIDPIVAVGVSFDTAQEVEDFFLWWEEEIARGTAVFIIESRFFGKAGSYGVRMTSPVVHKIPTSNKVTFTVEVLFDENTVDNEPPTALDNSIFVAENSSNNFILLSSSDLEDDDVTYQVTQQPTNGTLTGTPPNLMYTPAVGYVGPDSLVFICADVFAESAEATVSITVSDVVMASSEFTYMVSGPLGVSGNFHFDLGDGIVQVGAGGVLTPITDKIKVWSNDHRLDDRTDVVTGVTVNNWGERTDYSDFLKGQTGILSFSHSTAIGSCKGIIFDNMLEGFSAALSLFDTSNGTHFNGFLMSAGVTGIPAFDFSSGIYFARFAKGSAIKNTQYINSVKGEYFQEFFMDSDIECMGGINTTNKINTNGMFTNTPNLVNPDGAEQVSILAGTDWVSASPCIMTLNAITQETYTPPDIAVLDGTGVGTGTYKITYNDAVGGVPTFAWSCVGGTITAGSTTDTVTVSDTIGDTTDFSLTCTVTDGIGPIISPVADFQQTVNYTYLILDIPYRTTKLNLRDYIDANNPLAKTEVLVTVNRVIPTTETGDLTGLNVWLKIGSEIQAFSNVDGSLDSNTAIALELTSPIKVTSTGAIRGCGGKGGLGGEGANDTYITYSYLKRYTGTNCTPANQAFTFTDATGTPKTYLYWDSHVKIINAHTTAWYTIDGVADAATTVYRRSTYVTSFQCSYWSASYYIERRITNTLTRIGGLGGAGGRGVGYGTINLAGSYGAASVPSGGYSGGRGGSGQTWGTTGNTGAAGYGYPATGSTAGSAGLSGGKAIVGLIHLKAGSSIGGTVNGVQE